MFTGRTVTKLVDRTCGPTQLVVLNGNKMQSNFNGSNTFGTMKICSRQG